MGVYVPYTFCHWCGQSLMTPFEWQRSMWMGFSDEIEVAMIAINKATILEITGDDRIAIPMTFDNIRRAIAATKSTETCAARSEFLFCLAFLIFAFPSAFSSSSWLVKLAYSVITQDFLDMRRFILLKITPIWWKTRDENDVRRYLSAHREAHYYSV